MKSNFMHSFAAATVIPAIASTIKQAQREAAVHLHVLADYARRTSALAPSASERRLTSGERGAVEAVALVLGEQAFNGTVLFLLVNGAAAVAGPLGGMAAQVVVTWNTIITPEQTQRFNPARILVEHFDLRFDWGQRMSDDVAQRIAGLLGQFACSCGYGERIVDQPPRESFARRFFRLQSV